MFEFLFRRKLLRDPHCTPTRTPGCGASVSGLTYPAGYGPITGRAILNELRILLHSRPWLQTPEQLAGLIQQAARRARTRAENFIFSMGDAYENQLLQLEFNNVNVGNIGDAGGLRGSTAAGSFFVGLHTADPTEAGNQGGNEATFGSYARVGVARSAAGWTVAGNQVSNTAAITFGQNTTADQTISFFSIGTLNAGAGLIVRYGPLIAAGATWLPFTGRTDDFVTIPGNPFVVDDRITFAQAYDGVLPTGLTQGVVYWVKTSSGADLTVSVAQGGAAVDLTAVGGGVAIKAKPLVVRGSIDSVQFSPGTLISKMD